MTPDNSILKRWEKEALQYIGVDENGMEDLFADPAKRILLLIQALRKAETGLKEINLRGGQTLLQKCCVDDSCIKNDGTCLAQINAHNAFNQSATLARETLAEIEKILAPQDSE